MTWGWEEMKTTKIKTTVTIVTKKIATIITVPDFDRELHVSQKVAKAPEEDRPGGQKLNSTHAPA
jgi:hypothetical protein